MHTLLNGLRIADMTSVVLGPYATQILGDLGAEIIKVEPVSGDAFRAVRPGRSAELGAGFLNCNRNKRSIAIDLTNQRAAPVVSRLVETADCIVHNMRPASATKLGIDYEQVRAIKPDIVYCYACGFGQGGRLADEPAYDDTIQAASGMAYLNANGAGEPRFSGAIICDKVGGLHLALAVLAGLLSRRSTGQGVCIEAPMFESVVSFLMLEQLSGKTFRPPLGGIGYDRLLSPNRKPFATKDSYISILPYTRVHWERFLQLSGRQDLANSEIVQNPVKRSEEVDSLYSAIAAETPKRTTEEWLSLLRERDIPCSEVNRFDDLLHEPHLSDVEMFRTVDHPSEGPIVSVRSPFQIPGAPESPDLPAPRIGAHTTEVLAELGFSSSEVAQLIESKAVASHSETYA